MNVKRQLLSFFTYLIVFGLVEMSDILLNKHNSKGPSSKMENRDIDNALETSYLSVNGQKPEVQRLQPATREMNVEYDNGPRFGKRHGQILIYTCLIFIACAMRVDLSVCIVAMTDSSASANKNVPVFNWTDKSLVLSSFIWGYIWPQIGFGWLVSRYGSKWILVTGMSVCSILGLLLPTLAITFGYKGVIACRVLQGVGQSCVFPSVQSLLGKWVPVNERSRLGSFAHAGVSAGIVVGSLLSGYISASWYGWPMVYYVFYPFGLAWCILFAYAGSNSPSEHKTISQKEKLYIEKDLNPENNRIRRTPWAEICTSPAVWALVIVNCGFNWSFYTLLTETPIYMSRVMQFSIQSNGMLSSLPHLAQWITTVIFSIISDALMTTKPFSLEIVRKMMVIIGFAIPSISMIVLGNCGKTNVNMAVFAIIVSGIGNGVCVSGIMVNHMDLSPNYSGILMGITNPVSMGFSLFGPLLVQFLVRNEGDPSQWKSIFYLGAGIDVFVAIIFTIFGSAKVQQWNNPVIDSRNSDMDKEADSMVPMLHVE